MELLDYWLDCPPQHLLLRAIAQYDPDKKRGNWRKQRATDMDDDSYKPEIEKNELPRPESEADRQALQSFHGARHLDCAPGYIQEAIARTKRGDHMKIPESQR